MVVAQTVQEVSEVTHSLQKEKGYEVHFCPLGPRTMECIHRHQPAAIVVRVHKPEPTLYHIVEILRSDPVSSAIPIILCCTEPPDCEALVEQKQLIGIFITDFPCGADGLTARVEEAMASRWPPRSSPG